VWKNEIHLLYNGAQPSSHFSGMAFLKERLTFFNIYNCPENKVLSSILVAKCHIWTNAIHPLMMFSLPLILFRIPSKEILHSLVQGDCTK
jgi:hypothetical protein